MYLKGITSTNPIIQNTFAMRNPCGAIPPERSYYQVRLPLNNSERIANTRSVLESSIIRSIGSLVQHSHCEAHWITRHVQVEPPAVAPLPVSLWVMRSGRTNPTVYATRRISNNEHLKDYGIKRYILFLLTPSCMTEDIWVKGMIDELF